MSQAMKCKVMTAWAAAQILALCLPAAAQTQADYQAEVARRIAAQNAFIREIAMDPCNAKPKIPDMVKQLGGPMPPDRRTEMLEQMADTGCENLDKRIPELELLLVAGSLRYLDACTYSPGTNYSAEMKMARGSYSTNSFASFMKDTRNTPCMVDFIAALLTGQAPAPGTAPAAAPAASPEPPTRRRRTN
jgi:hypothetical protein